MPALVAKRGLFWDSSKSESKNSSNDSIPSLKEHPGSDSSCDDYKRPENYTLGVLSESLDKNEVNLIVEIDDV